MSSKSAIENENVLQPPRPPTGAPPLDPAGGLPSPDPLTCAVQKFPLKSPGTVHYRPTHYTVEVVGTRFERLDRTSQDVVLNVSIVSVSSRIGGNNVSVSYRTRFRDYLGIVSVSASFVSFTKFDHLVKHEIKPQLRHFHSLKSGFTGLENGPAIVASNYSNCVHYMSWLFVTT